MVFPKKNDKPPGVASLESLSGFVENTSDNGSKVENASRVVNAKVEFAVRVTAEFNRMVNEKSNLFDDIFESMKEEMRYAGSMQGVCREYAWESSVSSIFIL